MLLRFTVSNFLSFNEEISFSMIAGVARTLPSHVIKATNRNDVSLLKAAAIYGANASGKSNLIKAISFAQNLIVKGNSSHSAIARTPFRLALANKDKISKFEFEFKIDKNNYAYGFTLDNHKIHEEWLYEIDKVKEKAIFERQVNENKEVSVQFSNVEFKSAKDKNRLEFIAADTFPTQLLLTAFNERNIRHIPTAQVLIQVYQWFTDALTVIYPNSKYTGLNFNIDADQSMSKTFCAFLNLFDTGIDGVKTQVLDIDKGLKNVPDFLKKTIVSSIQETNHRVVITDPDDNITYAVTKNQAGKVKLYKLLTQHKIKDTEQFALFETFDESDGTQRMLDLIPILLDLMNENKVYIIDELDRSLHPSLSYKMIELFLKNTKGIKSQLIISTHESGLLDLDLLRRDEIWFVEKNKNGESSVYSLEEFQPRRDKKIEKGYLLGRYGAIPMIRNVGNLSWLK